MELLPFCLHCWPHEFPSDFRVFLIWSSIMILKALTLLYVNLSYFPAIFIKPFFSHYFWICSYYLFQCFLCHLLAGSHLVSVFSKTFQKFWRTPNTLNFWPIFLSLFWILQRVCIFFCVSSVLFNFAQFLVGGNHFPAVQSTHLQPTPHLFLLCL